MARSKKKLNETILKSLFDENINKIENKNRSNSKLKKNYGKKSSEHKKESEFQTHFDQDDKYETHHRLPHPPNQSTRPMFSTVQKIRVPFNMKSKKLDKNMACMNSFEIKNDQNCNEILNLTSLGISKSEISNNILNNSMNDLIKALEPKDIKQELHSSHNSNLISVENLNLDDSGSTIIYSFSSKPKPVSFVCNQFPYLLSNSQKKRNDIKIRKAPKISESGHNNNHSLTNDFLVNFKNHDLLDNQNQIDSFEAQMLHEIKDEIKINNSNDFCNSMVLELDQNEENKYYKQIRSPDLEYFEAYQRGLSDLTNPSEEIQTSEKYNFDVLTSSFEETSTSYSKKILNPKNTHEETNNYQDEMNISLLSNLPGKSINFKDIPLKYSPIQNQIPNEQNKIKTDIISEENHQLDDSQEDIDDISSDTNEEIDLLYDPTLNCYYDPKTSTYYELNLS